MTKHVEIWTLSKESRLVPLFSDKIEFFEYYPPPDMYVMDGKFEDRVERRYMDIIQVAKCSAIYDRLKIDSQIDRSDKYIAIHPDVEEAISVKWQEKIDTILSNAQTALNLTLDRIIGFNNLPWYKRVLKAICNNV